MLILGSFNVDDIFMGVVSSMNYTMNDSLITVFKEEEIKTAVKEMGSTKAPG